ncbi:MAG: hypothetical protein V7K18_06265 [Nostoc sp.]|uniref:hypothetical protein n=1 Tax=Nostoc sp. TaxID=1180 RepID=UPI002FF9B673
MAKIYSKVQVLAVPSDRMEQVTSVWQLSDVNPRDWAFQALQFLMVLLPGFPHSTLLFTDLVLMVLAQLLLINLAINCN